MNENKYERMSANEFGKFVEVRVEIEYFQEKEIVKKIGIITQFSVGKRTTSQGSKNIVDYIPLVCDFVDEELPQNLKIPVRGIRHIRIINE